MHINGYACDICGIEKKESNHWLLAHIYPTDISFTDWQVETNEGFVKFTKHLCGIGCANKLLSQTVESWSAVKEEK